jgi:hypothetical protein
MLGSTLTVVVGEGELAPATVEVHVIIVVGDELHVPQWHDTSTGELQLQVPTVSENPREPRGLPLCAKRSNQELLAALSYSELNQIQHAEKKLASFFLNIPGSRIPKNSKSPRRRSACSIVAM